MKKIFSFLLCFIILFSFVCVPVQAADENGFYSRNMVHKAYILQNVDNVLTAFDFTDHLTVSNGTYASKNCTVYTLNSGGNTNIKYVSSYQIKELNASHEYHLKFSASSNIIGDSNMCMVQLVFYNGDEVLKTQNLGGCVFENDQWQDVEFDFVPDASGIGGYSTRLEFLFMSYSNYNTVIYRLSDFIELVDKDDNASWFEKIINAIKELPNNFINGIRTFFDNLGNKITEIKDSISTFFNSLFAKISELSDNISGFFTSLGDRIKVFFIDLGNTIIDGLKYLFIPSDNYFGNKFIELQNFFEDKFGLFALPITLILRVLELYNNIGSEFSGEISVIPFEFFGVKLFDFSYVNLKELILGFDNVLYQKFGFNIYEFYLSFVDCLIILAFSKLIKNKYNSMFDTGSFDEIQSIYSDRRSTNDN